MTTTPSSTAASRREHGTFRVRHPAEEWVTRAIPGGALLLLATVLALLCANTPLADAYFGVRDAHVGLELGPLSLDLSIGHWASDGLLAVFFFLAGLELKQEFVVGDLRSPAKALVPIAAAFGGVAVPAILYTLINLAGPAGSGGGWAIPAATDIAFAVAILALLGSSLPTALRTFLLTLAIVDDLIAITIIAIFYTSDLRLGFLALALVPLGAFWWLTNRREAWFKKHYWTAWALLLPLAVITWVLFLNSGVHATIAGVCWPSWSPPAGSPSTGSSTRSPTPSSTGCVPSRARSRCPSSRSSAPASPSAGSRGCSRPGSPRSRSASSSDSWPARSWASSAPRSCSRA